MFWESVKKTMRVDIREERGAILITVLVMLVLLTTLGALAFLTSTGELGTSGNFRRANVTFYTADQAAEYAITDGNIYEQIPISETGGGSFPHSAAVAGDTVTSGLGNMTVVSQSGRLMAQAAGSNGTMRVRVEHLRTGPLPPGTGDEEEEVQGSYYYAATVGIGPSGGQAMTEAQFARKIPSK